MKKTKFQILALINLLAIFNFSAQAQIWKQPNNLNDEVPPVSIMADTNSACTDTSGGTRKIYLFSSPTNMWTTFAHPFLNPNPVGTPNGELRVIDNFNPTGSNNLSVTLKSSLVTPRYRPALGISNSDVYIFGGTSIWSKGMQTPMGTECKSVMPTTEVYKCPQGFNCVLANTTMPDDATEGMAIAKLNGKFYFFGGTKITSQNMQFIPNSASMMLNPQVSTCMQAPPMMGNPPPGHMNRVFIHRMNGSISNVNTVRVYDPATNSWTTAGNMPLAGNIETLAVTSVDGTIKTPGVIYVLIGNEFYKFTPGNPISTQWSLLDKNVLEGTSVNLPGGSVLQRYLVTDSNKKARLIFVTGNDAIQSFIYDANVSSSSTTTTIPIITTPSGSATSIKVKPSKWSPTTNNTKAAIGTVYTSCEGSRRVYALGGYSGHQKNIEVLEP